MEPEKIKLPKRGEDGYRVISVRIRENTLRRIDEAAGKANRSRNEVINLILERSVDLLEVEE